MNVKLRWMMKMNKVSAETVARHARRFGVSLMSAKRELECEERAVLQVYNEDIGEWEDVPFKVVYREDE